MLISWIIRILLLFFSTFVDSFAHALPRPLTLQEIVEYSDLIANIKVLEVQNYQSEYSITYKVQAKILSIEKGQANYNAANIITLCWTKDIAKQKSYKIIGNWYVEFVKGEKLLAYLKWNENIGCYNATSWNMKNIK